MDKVNPTDNTKRTTYFWMWIHLLLVLVVSIIINNVLLFVNLFLRNDPKDVPSVEVPQGIVNIQYIYCKEFFHFNFKNNIIENLN